MTKKKAPKKKKNEVAKQETHLPANSDYGEYEGEGYDNMDSRDLGTPLLNLLQSNSPAVTGTPPEKKVDGALPGMLIVSTTGQLISAEKGMILVPCATQHCYVEWIDRDKGGGGWVGMHGLHEEYSEKIVSTNKRTEKGVLLNPENGNHFVETFYACCMILDKASDIEPSGFIMVPFSSSKIAPYRKGIGALLGFMLQLPTGKNDEFGDPIFKKVKPPLFSHKLHITSVAAMNKSNQGYFNYAISPAVKKEGNTPEENRVISLIPAQLDGKAHPLLLSGRELSNQFLSGKTKVDYAGQDDSAGGGKVDPDEAAY